MKINDIEEHDLDEILDYLRGKYKNNCPRVPLQKINFFVQDNPLHDHDPHLICSTESTTKGVLLRSSFNKAWKTRIDTVCKFWNSKKGTCTFENFKKKTQRQFEVIII